MGGKKKKKVKDGGVEMSSFQSNYNGFPVQRNKWIKAPESKARSGAPRKIKFVLNVRTKGFLP